MHDLDGYLTHRVLTMDEAEANGELVAWSDIGVNLEPWQTFALKLLARSKGVELEDLLAAIIGQRADDILDGLA